MFVHAHTRLRSALFCALLAAIYAPVVTGADGEPTPRVVRTRQSGNWSDAATWEGDRVPVAGETVLVRPDHSVIYDVSSAEVLRAVHVCGRLEFDRAHSTRLECGLLRIQAGEETNEEGFDCDAHPVIDLSRPRPALLVGTPNQPVPTGVTATIRLHFITGMNATSCPAIVCCGGRMEFHGAPLSRTWAKLDHTIEIGATRVQLAQRVDGWRVGDRVIITGTKRDQSNNHQVTGTVASDPLTEERTITAIDVAASDADKPEQTILQLDRPVDHEHFAEGRYRAEVANLSRNVVVESATPDGVRGHTMFHAQSQGSISYAEFRHLGKRDTLGRYSLHFHLVGDSMRGSSVIGASIWDSHNRWITIHGTNYLVVRDCVGYRSIGHGYFLEDGTEINNLLDSNLAVMALAGKPHQGQVIPFDNNDGAGFWWANCRNAFVNNVAVECDEYGYRFEMKQTPDFDPILSIEQPDGSHQGEDTRLITFIRFDNNEAHLQRLFGINLRGISRPTGSYDFGTFADEVASVPYDYRHMFVIRNLKLWDTRWPFHAGASGVMVDGLDVFRSTYGIWRSVMDRHGYRHTNMCEIHHSDVFMPIAVPAPKNSEGDGYDPHHFPGIGTQGGEDLLPPATVITHVQPQGKQLRVTGTSIDSHALKHVTVNGRVAASLDPELGAWEVVLDAPLDGQAIEIEAGAEDEIGNVERQPHRVQWSVDAGLVPSPSAPITRASAHHH